MDTADNMKKEMEQKAPMEHVSTVELVRHDLRPLIFLPFLPALLLMRGICWEWSHLDECTTILTGAPTDDMALTLTKAPWSSFDRMDGLVRLLSLKGLTSLQNWKRILEAS